MDLTGHYLNSILKRKTVELQEKTAELEALMVAQYELACSLYAKDICPRITACSILAR